MTTDSGLTKNRGEWAEVMTIMGILAQGAIKTVSLVDGSGRTMLKFQLPKSLSSETKQRLSIVFDAKAESQLKLRSCSPAQSFRSP